MHGLSHYLGVEREWFYHRIRTGALCEPDVIRKPPYGNYLIRDDAALLARLRAALQHSHRRRSALSSGALSPVADDAEPALIAPYAMTSRTTRLAEEARERHPSSLVP